MTSDITQIPKISELGTQGSTTNEDIIERLETLSNQTGQLSKEHQTRPTKYNIQIRDLSNRDYKLKESLFLTVEEYPNDDVFLISYPEVEVFGEGFTEAEALFNLKMAILDLYDELIQTPEDELGELPKSWLSILKRVIEAN